MIYSTKKEKHFCRVRFCLFIVFAALIMILIKIGVEWHYQRDYTDLINEYHSTDTDKIVDSFSVYNDSTTSENTKHEIDADVDCILSVPALDVELPVCKGNFSHDIESYRLSAFSDKMILGETSYTIFGHHAIAMNVAFGWLDQVEMGTPIYLDTKSGIREYVVSEITVDFASELPYLFTIENVDVVYLASCDYTKAGNGKIVYRVIKCVAVT